jgi:hypothetical protein
LVEGNEYLLRLSRYIHLNPVFTKQLLTESLNNRLQYLCKYRWSSYRGYAGLGTKEDFVDYEPILAMTREHDDQQFKYRKYVEAGVAVSDEEFRKLIDKSPVGIGTEEFVKKVQEQYQRGAMRIKAEDVAFRKPKRVITSDSIIKAVCQSYKISTEDLLKQRLNGWVKPVTAALLTQAGGLSQREAAAYLGITTGAAVCLQLKRLRDHAPPEHQQIIKRLMQEFNI